MKRLILFCFFITFGGLCTVWSCINEFGEDSDGETMELDPDFHYLNIQSNFEIESIYSSLQRDYQDLISSEESYRKPYEVLSDYGVKLLQLGFTEDALTIFQRLNENYPRNYRIIANLGTTYELAGQLDSALKYIQLGIDIFNESHRGSEWVHVKILEAKIKMLEDSTWLDNNWILGPEFENVPKFDKDSPSFDSLQHVAYHILHQLRERSPFVKGYSPYIAQLFMNLGDMLYQNIDVEAAYKCYLLAEIHSPTKKPEIEKRIQTAFDLLKKRNIEIPLEKYIYIPYAPYEDEIVLPDLNVVIALGFEETVEVPDFEFPEAQQAHIEMTLDDEFIEDNRGYAVYITVGGGILLGLVIFLLMRRKRS